MVGCVSSYSQRLEVHVNKYLIEVDFSDGEFELTAGELGPFFLTEDVVESIAINLVGVPVTDVIGCSNFSSWASGLSLSDDVTISNAYVIQDRGE